MTSQDDPVLRPTEKDIADVWDTVPDDILDIAAQLGKLHNQLAEVSQLGFSVPGLNGVTEKLKDAHLKLKNAHNLAKIHREHLLLAVKFLVDQGADAEYIKFAVASGIVKYDPDELIKIMEKMGGD